MCGIVGYVGHENCVEHLIKGLRSLEYRGYDSAGVAVIDGGILRIRKAKGRLAMLEGLIEALPVDGTIGIGHTRWATHGEPNDVNAHPHADIGGKLAIVHNGIIENYFALKRRLEASGVVFASETDTEVIAQLLGHYYDGDMKATLYRVLPLLEGSFALAVLDVSQPGTLFAARKNSPLVVGKGENAHLVASDIPALLSYSRDVYFMEDGEVAVLTESDAQFFDAFGNALDKDMTRIDWKVDAAEKGGYPHFMLKEICEEPEALRNTLAHYVQLDNPPRFREGSLPFTKEEIAGVSRVTILACGTAYHAGMLGRALIEAATGMPVQVEIASEYRYGSSPVLEGELCVVVSQSGETADTIAAMRKARSVGTKVVALCNVIGSTIAREADAVLYTLAGPEIAVASTKAYVTQVLLFELLALDWGQKRGRIDGATLAERLGALSALPEKAAALIEESQIERIQQLASRVFDSKSVFFIGRGLDYATALEAALKLKEISYIHSESYAAGELKHGTIALVEEGTLVVAMATQGGVRDKMASNIEEVRVRGAHVLTILPEGDSTGSMEQAGELWRIPRTDDALAPLLSIIPLQLFAYFMALEKGCDIDKPRNLAKSVTVE